MMQLIGFFDDRRGLAIVDYGFGGMLLFITATIASHFGNDIARPLWQMLAGIPAPFA